MNIARLAESATPMNTPDELILLGGALGLISIFASVIPVLAGVPNSALLFGGTFGVVIV